MVSHGEGNRSRISLAHVSSQCSTLVSSFAADMLGPNITHASEGRDSAGREPGNGQLDGDASVAREDSPDPPRHRLRNVRGRQPESPGDEHDCENQGSMRASFVYDPRATLER